MLEGLENVNWFKHKGAYHLKDKVPGLIRNLTSTDNKVRKRACEDIGQEMNHQGSIYDATPYIVPFLIELLTYDHVPDKEELLYSLWVVLESCESAFRYSPQMSDKNTQNCILTYNNLSEGFPVFASLLQNPDLNIRLPALLLASSLTLHAPYCRHLLRRVYCTEPDSMLRALILARLGELVPKGYGPVINRRRQKYVAMFESIAQSDPDSVVRLGAALGWAKSHPHYPYNDRLTVPQPVRDELLQGLSYAAPKGNVGWLVGAEFNADAVMEAFIGLGWKQVAGSLNSPVLDRYQVHRLARSLLDVIYVRKSTRPQQSHAGDLSLAWWEFEAVHLDKTPEVMTYRIPDRFPRTFNPAKPQLNQPRQKEIIAAIVNCDRFWELPTNLFSFFYDLPDSREALNALVVG